MIVLGSIGVVAYAVIIPTSVHFSATFGFGTALNQTEDAYNALQTPANTFVSDRKACRANATSTTEELQCLQSTDTAFGNAIQGYENTLNTIYYPSSVQGQANAAIAAAQHLDAQLQSLATAPDPQTYNSIENAPAFNAALNSLDSTYNQLITALNGT